MDVLLIDPPHACLKGIKTDRGYHVGLTSLAAYLIKAGIETSVLSGNILGDSPSTDKFFRQVSWTASWLKFDVNMLATQQRAYAKNVDDPDYFIWGRLADILKQTRPGVVGISYLSPLKYSVERTARIIKEIDPEIKIVAGSFHPTFHPDEVMQNPDIDFLIRGEGEIPLLALVKEIKKGSLKWETVPGIYYKDSDGEVRHNPGVGRIDNLDELPFPARDAVLNCDFNRYTLHSICTTRGCPYNCAFCSDRGFWGGKVRRRSVENVIEEISLLNSKYRVSNVDIIDGTFTFDRKYLEAFCKSLIDRNMKINWRSTARYDNLDAELLRLMKKSNCSGLYLGLESGSEKTLESINKKETVAHIVNVSNMVKESGILSITSVLIGLPDDGREEIEETLTLMRKFKTDFFDVNCYVPLPGTSLYESMSEEERQLIDWRNVNYKSNENYFSKRLSNPELSRFRSEAYKIANSLRKKSLLRLSAGRLGYFLARPFRRAASRTAHI